MTRGWARVAVATLLAVGLSGCLDAERSFRAGRRETLCEDTIPICGTRASCILSQEEFLRRRFPGGLEVVVDNEYLRAEAVVRILLTEERFAGSELQIRLFGGACADFDELRFVDQNVFDIAGPEGLIEARLDLEGRGDHLLEIFSDSTAEYLLTVDVFELPPDDEP